MPATDSRMQIETAEAGDCRAVATVHVESWQHVYRDILPAPYLASLSVDGREALWLRLVERRQAHLLVARSAGQITGFVAFGPSRDEDAAPRSSELWALYVRPACLSTGAGRALWLAALRQMQEEAYASVSLWVIADNTRAIRFYERAGFVAEPESRKAFELGGARLWEVRYGRDCAGSANTPSP
jgi:ribosomal protein S18 acetylase RimI-like enzyme